MIRVRYKFNFINILWMYVSTSDVLRVKIVFPVQFRGKGLNILG